MEDVENMDGNLKTKTKQLSAKYYEPGPKRHTHFDRKVFEKLLVVVQ